MAVHNEIQVGRYNRFFQKLLSLKGAASVRSLVPEIGGVWNLFHGAENRYLEGWDRFAVTHAFLASAANLNEMRIRNPVGSNLIAVIEKIIFSNSSGGNDQYNVSAATVGADLATIISTATIGPWDNRGRSGPGMILSFTQAAANNNLGGTQKWAGNAPTSQAIEVIGTDIAEIPLAPGSAIEIENATLNVPSAFSIWWRERFLEDSERT